MNGLTISVDHSKLFARRDVRARRASNTFVVHWNATIKFINSAGIAETVSSRHKFIDRLVWHSFRLLFLQFTGNANATKRLRVNNMEFGIQCFSTLIIQFRDAEMTKTRYTDRDKETVTIFNHSDMEMSINSTLFNVFFFWRQRIDRRLRQRLAYTTNYTLHLPSSGCIEYATT